MKTKHYNHLIFNILNLFVLVFVLSISACKKTEKKAEYIQINGEAQGSTYHIVYENNKNCDLTVSIDSILQEVDKSLSIYNKESIISRINCNDTGVRVDPILSEVIRQSFIIWNKSKGAFDITVGPIVKSWGFGPDGRRVPKNNRIDTLLKYVGMHHIMLSGNKLIKKYPSIILDVNAIAQGYSVDLVCNYFDSLGLKNYLVEIGGEVKTKGKNNKGESWKVGIDKPLEENTSPGSEIQAVFPLENLAMSTSGNYRKFYVENGIKYSHTINPHTGFPAHNTLLSATIIAKSCATADALATCCMVMGLDEAKKFISKQNGVSAYFIYSQQDNSLGEYLTDDIKNKIIK